MQKALTTLPSVAIVVLNYNGRADTLACLQSLTQVDYPHARVIVVDNGSTDGSVAAFRAAYSDLEIIETGANLGFAAGNNVGIRRALADGTDYVLLLNNDTEVAPDFLSALIHACGEDPTIGIAGPKIYYYDTPRTIWSIGGVIDWRRGCSRMRGVDEVDQGQFDTPVDVDFITGCALLVRREALDQAGLLDERFGMYYEETEWCVRIARAGWRVVTVPQSVLWHKIRPNQQDQSPRITYYMTRNRLLFLRLTRAPFRTWFHALVLQDLRTWVSWRIRRRWRWRAAQRDALFRAWWDFLQNRFGMLT